MANSISEKYAVRVDYENYKRITFYNTIIDEGGNYDNTTGLYNCPYDGIYLFSYTVYTLYGNGTVGSAALGKRGGTLTESLLTHGEDGKMSSSTSNMVLTECRPGQKVYVFTAHATSLFNWFKLNFFTGFMIMPKDDISNK